LALSLLFGLLNALTEHLNIPLTIAMDSSIDYGMDDDAYNNDSQESQQQTQSTQQASQPQMDSEYAHLWGYMQPCNASLTRIDFWKIHPKYNIGRNTESNQVILPGFKVSK
jgi:serine/threonine/tyrosine protein kinase RAD53